MDSTIVLRTLEEMDAHRVQVGGFDLDGVLRGKSVSREKFASAADYGFGFCDVIFGWDTADELYDRAQFTGWHTGYPDLTARLDISTLRKLPWEPRTAICLADFHGRDGEPLPFCPRSLLKRVVAKAESMGFAPKMAFEYEFVLFEETPETIEAKGHRGLAPESPGNFCYSLSRLSSRSAWANDLVDTLAALGIEAEGLHTESGPGMFEACIKYSDALAAADNAGLFKLAVKQVARKHGLFASFMAKWNTRAQGCGGHIHQSLGDGGGVNIFQPEPGAHGSTPSAARYIAGQQRCLPEWMAMLCPTVNSYKRLVPDFFAPTHATWGIENRTNALRYIPGPSPKSARLETRLPGADACPHLAAAACLAAGLYGIEHGLTPTEPTTGNAYAGTEAPPLPRTLHEATARLRASESAGEALGAAFVDHFAMSREWECREFDKAVTDWELRRYLEII